MIDVDLPLPPQPTAPPSTVRLIHGDCLEVMPTLASKSVALVFADLPFGCTRNVWDRRIDTSQFFASVEMLGADNAACVLMADMAFAAHLVTANPKLYRYDIVWEKKGRPSGHLNANRQPLRSHEHILVFGKKGCIYNPQMVEGEPYKSRNKVGPHDGGGNYGAFVKKPNPSLGPRYPRSIIAFNRVERPQHPTQKPVALMEWLVATYTNPGDTVLDPVMGSGVMGSACARLGRNFIGVEKDEAYFKVASKRIADERARLGLSND